LTAAARGAAAQLRDKPCRTAPGSERHDTPAGLTSSSGTLLATPCY